MSPLITFRVSAEERDKIDRDAAAENPPLPRSEYIRKKLGLTATVHPPLGRNSRAKKPRPKK